MVIRKCLLGVVLFASIYCPGYMLLYAQNSSSVIDHRQNRLHYFSDAELGATIAGNSARQASEMLINQARERAASILYWLIRLGALN